MPTPHGDKPQRIGAIRRRRGFEDGERIGGVNVCHAVGHQDDVVERLRTFSPHRIRQPYAEVQSRLHVCAVVRLEPGDGVGDGAVVGRGVLDREVIEHVSREMHHRNPVVPVQAPPDGLSRLASDGHPGCRWTSSRRRRAPA